MAADAEMPLHLELNESSSVAGDGLLTVRGAQGVYGNYASRLRFASDAEITLFNTTMGSNVVIEAGAVVAFTRDDHAALNLNGVLTNRGTFRQVGNYYMSKVTGSGRVENEGLLNIVLSNVSYDRNSYAQLRVPVNVTSSGRLLVDTNASLNIGTGSSLSSAGVIELQSGGFMRFEGGPSSTDLTLATGATIIGSGVVELQGNNRLVIAGDAALTGATLRLVGSTTAAGPGALTIGSGATLYVDHSLTLPGSVVVAGVLTVANPGTTLVINGVLTLEAGGVLNNPGTIQVGIGEFINHGGTIIGNLPQEIGGTSIPPQSAGSSFPARNRRASGKLSSREHLARC